MVIFQYNIYIFVWILHGCLTNMVYAMDPNNSVIKRLWCNFITVFDLITTLRFFSEILGTLVVKYASTYTD